MIRIFLFSHLVLAVIHTNNSELDIIDNKHQNKDSKSTIFTTSHDNPISVKEEVKQIRKSFADVSFLGKSPVLNNAKSFEKVIHSDNAMKIDNDLEKIRRTNAQRERFYSARSSLDIDSINLSAELSDKESEPSSTNTESENRINDAQYDSTTIKLEEHNTDLKNHGMSCENINSRVLVKDRKQITCDIKTNKNAINDPLVIANSHNRNNLTKEQTDTFCESEISDLDSLSHLETLSFCSVNTSPDQDSDFCKSDDLSKAEYSMEDIENNKENTSNLQQESDKECTGYEVKSDKCESFNISLDSTNSFCNDDMTKDQLDTICKDELSDSESLRILEAQSFRSDNTSQDQDSEFCKSNDLSKAEHSLEDIENNNQNTSNSQQDSDKEWTGSDEKIEKCESFEISLDSTNSPCNDDLTKDQLDTVCTAKLSHFDTDSHLVSQSCLFDKKCSEQDCEFSDIPEKYESLCIYLVDVVPEKNIIRLISPHIAENKSVMQSRSNKESKHDSEDKNNTIDHDKDIEEIKRIDKYKNSGETQKLVKEDLEQYAQARNEIKRVRFEAPRSAEEGNVYFSIEESEDIAVDNDRCCNRWMNLLRNIFFN